MFTLTLFTKGRSKRRELATAEHIRIAPGFDTVHLRLDGPDGCYYLEMPMAEAAKVAKRLAEAAAQAARSIQ